MTQTHRLEYEAYSGCVCPKSQGPPNMPNMGLLLSQSRFRRQIRQNSKDHTESFLKHLQIQPPFYDHMNQMVTKAVYSSLQYISNLAPIYPREVDHRLRRICYDVIQKTVKYPPSILSYKLPKPVPNLRIVDDSGVPYV